jgi:hypothetical protein
MVLTALRSAEDTVMKLPYEQLLQKNIKISTPHRILMNSDSLSLIAVSCSELLTIITKMTLTISS